MSEWTDIGEQLRKARESKGLDLMDIAHTTRIPVATLSALEKSDYSIFPSPAYARSFLAQYSEYLDVDANEWIDAFATGDVLSNVSEHSYLQAQHDHIGDLYDNPEPDHRRGQTRHDHNDGSPKGSKKSYILQTLTVFVATALLVAGGIYAYKKYEPMLTGTRDGQTEETTIEDNTNPADFSPAPTTSSTAEQPASPVEADGTSETSPSLVAQSSHPTTSANNGTHTDPSANDNPETAPPLTIKPNRSGPPPKAMVIDENEE